VTIHYGKRNPGALTAASPGDSIYIPLAFYNDSGASISIGSTLVAADIELFKDGSVTQRATDSGYTVLGDTGNFDNRIGFKGIRISLFNTADDASFYAVGSTYWVAIDSVTVDGRTVRFWPAVFEIGENRANIVQVNGDTGAANQLGDAFANGFSDTGIQERLARIQSDVDTGLRVHIDDSDTGLKDTIADLDTGIRALLALRDTGAIATAVWAGDTGLRDHITNVDTGITNRLNTIAFDVDTGLRAQISDVDTGLHDALADYDTGVRALLTLRDTGAIANAVWGFATRSITASSDTGINERLDAIETKTGSLTFTVAGQVDANVQSVNDVTVTGTGTSGDPWGP
jgi:hypothetical protein